MEDSNWKPRSAQNDIQTNAAAAAADGFVAWVQRELPYTPVRNYDALVAAHTDFDALKAAHYEARYEGLGANIAAAGAASLINYGLDRYAFADAPASARTGALDVLGGAAIMLTSDLGPVAKMASLVALHTALRLWDEKAPMQF